MKGKKFIKRAATVALATAVVLQSVQLLGMETSAGEPYKPYFNQSSREYIYESGDVFGAATHVHFFANEISSSAHTHGNVFCKTADLSEYGTRTSNNDLGNPLPCYDEVSYIRDSITNLNGASRINTLVVGSGIKTGRLDERYTVTTAGGSSVKLDNTDHVYTSDTAIDFEKEFNALKALSTQWAGAATAPSTDIECKITGQENQNSRQINLSDGVADTSNAYLKFTYDEWNGNEITVNNLDGNAANKGILVINIDMAGRTSGDLGLLGGGMKVNTTEGSFINKEYKTSEYGACRIAFNIIDSSNADGQLYTGSITFKNVVMGSILAPAANVTVGAVNGTVMAQKIDHNGEESHRMDIWALDTSGENAVVPDNTYDASIVVRTTYNGSLNNVSDDMLNHTEFGLFTDSRCSGTPIAKTHSVRDAGGAYGVVTFVREFDNLSNGENVFYIKELNCEDGYQINTWIDKSVITKDGTNIKVEYLNVDTRKYQEEPLTYDHSVKESSGGEGGSDTPGGSDGGSSAPGGEGGSDTPSGGDGSSGTPGGEGGSDTPGGSDGGSSTPGGEGGSDTPGGGDGGSTPGGEGGSDTPGGSDGGSSTPGGEGGSDTPGGGDGNSGTPGGEGGSDTPGGGDGGSDTPDKPSKPSKPGKPSKPDTSDDTSDTPSDPDTPDTPGTPNTPGNPDAPNTPGNPGTPNPSKPSGGSGTTNTAGTSKTTDTSKSTGKNKTTETNKTTKTTKPAGTVKTADKASNTSGSDKVTATSMVSAQTGESTAPFVLFGGSMAVFLLAGVIYVCVNQIPRSKPTEH